MTDEEFDELQRRWEAAVNGRPHRWMVAPDAPAPFVDMVQMVTDFQRWTFGAFGPLDGGQTWRGTLVHLKKEIKEVEATAAGDVEECADLIMLAISTALRGGHTPQAIVDAVGAKLAKNQARVWPDWRTMDRDGAIEHDRRRTPQ